ncbi:MAG TPA: M14 family metallopeptidase, partial [Terriglobales bacterium]|nr:M14 family metallopeptidase [Terriglobales bacterium]
MRLTVLDHLPNGLLELAPAELYRVLSGPTLIHLPGRREQPLLVSTLLHGNEDTGFRALQSVLRRYRDQSLPRALSLFIGNVEAARYGLRKLDAQPDFNRVWLGGERRGYAEENVALEVLDQMQRRALFASIDVHNNTGRNPHYVCATHLEAPALHLATLFSRIVVYFTTPKGTQAEAFGSLCPAVTVECGKPGVTGGELHAAEYIEACLHLSALPAHPVPPQDIDLFHTVAVVKVRDEVSFSFGGGEAGAIFDAEIDRFNFCE